MGFLEHTFTFLMILTTCSLPENGLFGKYRVKSLISEIERFLLFLNFGFKDFLCPNSTDTRLRVGLKRAARAGAGRSGGVFGQISRKQRFQGFFLNR